MFGKTFGLFANPYIPDEYFPRRNICLRVSSDFKHWAKVNTLLTPTDELLLGYCSIAQDKLRNKIYFVYETNDKGILFCNLDFCIDEIMSKYVSLKYLYE